MKTKYLTSLLVRRSRFLPLLFLLFFVPAQGNTQNSFGLRAGGGFNFLGPGFEHDYRERLGYSLGVTSHIQLIPNLYINPEINYTRKSFRYLRPAFLDEQLADSDVILGLNYLDIPINVGYGAWAQHENGGDMFIFLYGGFQYFRLLSQDNRFKTRGDQAPENIDIGEFDEIRKTDLGINIGIGIGYKSFFFEGRYFFGVVSLFESDYLDDFTNSVNLSVSYRFKLN